MRWTQFRAEQPELAAFGARLLAERHGYSYLATVDRLGAPRLHPVAPILLDDGLFVAVLRRSRKLEDLRHDGRLALHTSVRPPDDEEWVLRGTVATVDDPDRRAEVGAADHDGATLTDAMALVEVDLREVVWVRWDDGVPRRRRWVDGDVGSGVDRPSSSS